MHATSQVLWASILASAAVAVVTTLVIEYLAKPWLEVRKDRILERSQQRRKALRDFRRVTLIVLQLVELHGHSTSQILLDRGVKYAAEAEELLMDVEEPDIPSQLQTDWDNAITAALTFLYWMQKELPPERRWDDFTQIVYKLIAYNQLFKAPRWRWLKKRKLIRQIQFLNEVTLQAP